MIVVPTFNPAQADWEAKITLGTQEMSIRFQWNTRASFWFVDLDDQQGHTLRSRKLVPLIPLNLSHRALFPMSGDFVLLPNGEPVPEYPTFEGLGTTHILVWMDPTELEEWETALGIQ